jgi:thiol:disulfide interchange protein DsbA
MRRREWTFGAGGLVGLALAGCAARPAPPPPGAAERVEPVEIQDYVALDKPLSVTLAPGKAVEVVEFFWYECPHCNAFEPLLEQWLGRQERDLQFRRVPVGFTPRHEATQRLFYALAEIGEVERLHAKVFDAIHRRARPLLSEREQTEFVAAEGADAQKFALALRSPRVAAQMRSATELSDAYEVDRVPTLGIHGRFYTNAGMAGSRQRALAVADALIRRCREGR